LQFYKEQKARQSTIGSAYEMNRHCQARFNQCGHKDKKNSIMQIIVDLFAYFRKILYLCRRKFCERRRRQTLWHHGSENGKL